MDFANGFLEESIRLPFSAQPRIISYRILSISDGVGGTQRGGQNDIKHDNAVRGMARKLNGACLNEKRFCVNAVHERLLTVENTRSLSETSRQPYGSVETKVLLKLEVF